MSKPTWRNELSEEERELQVDTLLGVLRKLMINPDASCDIKQSKPVDNSGLGFRYKGYTTMSIQVIAPMHPFCRHCGNSGAVPVFGVYCPDQFPSCTCECGDRRRRREGSTKE